MTTSQLYGLSSFLVGLAGCFSPSEPVTTDSGAEGSTSLESGDETGDGTDTEIGSTSEDTQTPTSSSTTSQPSTDADSSETGEVDVVPPTVVAVSPESGVLGVADDVSIVITFSEPMDRSSAQAAWQSSDIGEVVMSWNTDDTELTIVPGVPLEYATGDDVDALDPIEYSFAIAAAASDKAGNSLENAFSSSFSTFRLVVLQPTPVPALTGMTYLDGAINDSAVYVGDVQGDTQQKGVMSFELPELPDGVEVVAATVWADQSTVVGAPYGLLPALGDIHAIHIEFDSEWDAWPAPALADVGLFSDDAALETKTIDVTAAVADDYDEGRLMSQYRLEFPVATNGNAAADRATFPAASTGMELRYLIE